MRIGKTDRKTEETEIHVEWNLDGSGKTDINTGIGFFDHMLNLFAFHGNMDLKVIADGDLDVDDHHTIEDIGIAMGQAFRQAIGDKKGIHRYGSFLMPMDESLAQIAIDISGRPFLVYHAEYHREQIGMLSTEMIEEFFRAFAMNSQITLHVNLLYGNNDHHKAEAIFKGFGHALAEAVCVDSDRLVSTKGMLA